MKGLLITVFLCISFLVYGQSVDAPNPKSFLQSTNAQDASGFNLSGFNSNSTLLASISLINSPQGVTFYLTTTSGLSPASGFSLSGNKTRLVFTGTQQNINNALSSLKVNTGSVTGNVQISVAATVNPTGYFYNGVNGHFYRPISSGTTYTNARAAALNTTFKGQQGYLVTITSADEDQFIFNNVPQGNIWFAITDEVSEGRWVIDAGPERGTLIKTSNGQFTGNIQGQYNNWAPGEPNNWGNNEDYAVTKWAGGSQWNDLGNNHSNPYVIEYGTWTDPDDQTFTEFYTNSVIHSNGEVLRAQFNFEFGESLDKTKFTAKLLAQTNNQYLPTTDIAKNLNGLGRVDMTSDLDVNQISDGGFKASTTPGNIEWCVIYSYDVTNQRYRIGIDNREFSGSGVSPSLVNRLKLFDLWDGAVTYKSSDIYWNEYWIYTPTQFNFSTSTFSQNIRAGNGFYALRADFTFNQSQSYKPHAVKLNTTNVASLYNNIVTVSDVFLAFKELSNKGLFGNESGNEFTSGIQFMNADIDGNGIFDENDTYKLLQHLVGSEIIGDGSSNISDYMKILPKSEYNEVTNSNWNTYPNFTTDTYSPINLSSTTLLNNFIYSVFWKGDVNMSHSPPQTTSNKMQMARLNQANNVIISKIIDAFIVSEIINDNLVVTISLNPLNEIVVGTQFQLNYDNTRLKFENVEFITKGNPTNFGSNRGTFINIGSLISNGIDALDETTEYKIIFSLLDANTNILGLTSIAETDAVDINGAQLKIKLK